MPELALPTVPDRDRMHGATATDSGREGPPHTVLSAVEFDVVWEALGLGPTPVVLQLAVPRPHTRGTAAHRRRRVVRTVREGAGRPGRRRRAAPPTAGRSVAARRAAGVGAQHHPCRRRERVRRRGRARAPSRRQRRTRTLHLAAVRRRRAPAAGGARTGPCRERAHRGSRGGRCPAVRRRPAGRPDRPRRVAGRGRDRGADAARRRSARPGRRPHRRRAGARCAGPRRCWRSSTARGGATL